MSSEPTSAIPAKPPKTAKASKPEVTSIDDLLLPRSHIIRLAKSVLPPTAAIQKQAVQALSQSSTVFVNFLCASANECARQAGRKAIGPQDIVKAMKLIEFEDFLPRLEVELSKLQETTSSNSTKGKGKREPVPKDTPRSGEEEAGDTIPMAKRVRVLGDEDGGVPEESVTVDAEESDTEDDGDPPGTDDEYVVSDDEPEDEASGRPEEKEFDEVPDHPHTEEDEALDESDISD